MIRSQINNASLNENSNDIKTQMQESIIEGSNHTNKKSIRDINGQN